MADWTQRPGFPPKGKDGWDVEACRAYRNAQLASANDRRGRGNGETVSLPDLQRQRIKKLERENALLDLRIKRISGEMIPAEEVEVSITFLMTQFSAALDILLSRVETGCKDTPRVVEIVRGAINETRLDLCEWIRKATDSVEHSSKP